MKFHCPRIKEIYPIYKLHDNLFRVGSQIGITTEISDEDDKMWSLVNILDGRAINDVVDIMLTKYPDLTEQDIIGAIELLDKEGVIEEDATINCIIEKSNLGRQFLYKEEDVGALKTQIAHQEVSKMNSDIEVETHNLRITCVNDLLPLLDNVDIVICVIDEPQYDIQRIVNKAVVTKNIPCVFGASQVSRGRVYSVVPHQTGCFDCLNIHYTKIDSLFLEQFRGIRTVTKKIPTIAYGPAMFQLTSAIVDEAVRLITKYAEPMSLNRQYEINYENGASFTHKPWGHYPDECPTCGNGKEENWEIFSQYGEIKL